MLTVLEILCMMDEWTGREADNEKERMMREEDRRDEQNYCFVPCFEFGGFVALCCVGVS